MSFETAITRFRRKQAARFTTESLVQRQVSEGEFNETTGLHEPPEMQTIYSGPCLIRAVAWVGSDVQLGEREVRLRGLRGKYPVDTPIRKDDLVTVTASRHDADLVGQVLRVTDVLRDEWQTARVVTLEEVTDGVSEPEEEESP